MAGYNAPKEMSFCQHVVMGGDGAGQQISTNAASTLGQGGAGINGAAGLTAVLDPTADLTALARTGNHRAGEWLEMFGGFQEKMAAGPESVDMSQEFVFPTGRALRTTTNSILNDDWLTVSSIFSKVLNLLNGSQSSQRFSNAGFYVLRSRQEDQPRLIRQLRRLHIGQWKAFLLGADSRWWNGRRHALRTRSYLLHHDTTVSYLMFFDLEKGRFKLANLKLLIA